MRRLWRLPAAMVELSVGTTIVMIHAALADREQRRKRLRADPPARRSMPPDFARSASPDYSHWFQRKTPVLRISC